MPETSEPTSPGDANRAAPFVWPPRPAPADAALSTRTTAVAAPIETTRPLRARLADAFAEAERFWLAPTAEPLPRRAARAGWAPDPPDAYCNRCGLTVGPHEADEFGCAACREASWPWDRFVRLGPYEGALRDWVHEVKFTRWRRLGVDLGRLLGQSLLVAGIPRSRVLVAPTPMALPRRLVRGTDHARAIAQGVGRTLQAPVAPVLRARAHKAQRSLPRSARSGNVAGAFQPLAGPKLGGWTVVVVDDVRTTGATLAAQCRAIRRGWPDVENLWVAALAVTPTPDRRAEGERPAGGDGGGF